MDMGRFTIEVHLRTGRPIKELAAAHEVSPSWLFKLLRRYRLEGPGGLEPRSRRPRHSPTRVCDLYEEEIVAIHKSLADDGLDAGAATVHHIGVGRAYYGWRIAMLIEGRNIEIVGLDGSALRRLVLDPTKDYQRMP